MRILPTLSELLHVGVVILGFEVLQQSGAFQWRTRLREFVQPRAAA